MFEKLTTRGFQIEFSSHAEAILGGDFPEVASQLEEVLLDSTIPIEEIIGSGGGETKGTQRLRNALAEQHGNNPLRSCLNALPTDRFSPVYPIP